MVCFTKFQKFQLISFLRISVIDCVCEFWKETHTQTYTEVLLLEQELKL